LRSSVKSGLRSKVIVCLIEDRLIDDSLIDG
jgi:hypothetical protein